MAYTGAQGREQLLNTVAAAIEQIGLALACVGAAYERVDEQTAERLERELFLPVQRAYGRAQRTHSEFARRHGLAPRSFTAASAGAPSRSVRDLLDGASDAVSAADTTLATLQDSMLPVEVGDPELRSGLQEVRLLLGELRGRTRELMRTLGR